MQLPIENILKGPRITEKATVLAGRQSGPIYTFEVATAANKKQIVEAIQHYYKVKPLKVNIVSMASRKAIVRRTQGVKSALKKALVYLKKGDVIEFV